MTHESGTQIFVYRNGELAVHNNVVFLANSASRGGAVSLLFIVAVHLPVAAFWFCEGWFDRFCEGCFDV